MSTGLPCVRKWAVLQNLLSTSGIMGKESKPKKDKVPSPQHPADGTEPGGFRSPSYPTRYLVLVQGVPGTPWLTLSQMLYVHCTPWLLCSAFSARIQTALLEATSPATQFQLD